MKKFFVFLLILVVVSSSAYAEYETDGFTEVPDLYPIAGRVVKVDHEMDYTAFTDGNGRVWYYFEASDFEFGEIVAALIGAMETPEDFDDLVLALYHAGEF